MHPIRWLLPLGLLCLACNVVHAQDYPSRPVRIIVGFTPGATADVLARLLSQHLSPMWGQPVVVESRMGAGGTIAADLVAKAPPDGYTLLLGELGSSAAAAGLYGHLPYDPLNSFAHITRIASFPLTIVVSSGSSMKTLKDLLAQAKAQPGKLRYSSGGVATAPHLFLELMNYKAGISTEAIQYKGASPAIAALLAGEVDYSIGGSTVVASHLRSGSFRAIAVTSATASPSMPDVPPVATEVPGYEAIAWYGLSAPAKTPPAVIDKVNRDVLRVMQLPDVKARMDGLSIHVAVTTSDEYTAFIRKEVETWSKLIRTADIKPN